MSGLYPLDTNLIADYIRLAGGVGREAEEWRIAFRTFMSKEDPWDTRLLVIRPWRTVRLGVHKTPQGYLEAIVASGRKLEDHVPAMIGNTPIAKEETEIELFRLSTEELQLGGGTRYSKVVERMSKFGLGFCPPEVSLALAADPESMGGTPIIEGVMTKEGIPAFFTPKWVDGEHWLDSGPVKEIKPFGTEFGYTCQFIFTDANQNT